MEPTESGSGGDVRAIASRRSRSGGNRCQRSRGEGDDDHRGFRGRALKKSQLARHVPDMACPLALLPPTNETRTHPLLLNNSDYIHVHNRSR